MILGDVKKTKNGSAVIIQITEAGIRAMHVKDGFAKNNSYENAEKFWHDLSGKVIGRDRKYNFTT